MLDWLGSLRVREISPLRVVLGLSRTTRVVGLVLLAAGLYGCYLAWPISRWLVVLPGLVAGFGAVLATLHRKLVFDREEGVLQVDQRIFGLANRSVVPLFHLRAVIIRVGSSHHGKVADRLISPTRYVSYVERRIGEDIFLDESRRCAYLLHMAEAIAEVAELRLEYDATSQASGGN